MPADSAKTKAPKGKSAVLVSNKPRDDKADKTQNQSDKSKQKETKVPESPNMAKKGEGVARTNPQLIQVTENLPEIKPENISFKDADEEILAVIEKSYSSGPEILEDRLKGNLLFYKSRFVELMIRASFDKDRVTAENNLSLLPQLVSKRVLYQRDVILGVDKVVQNIDDLELDTPYCSLKTLGLLNTLLEKKCIYPTYMKMLPQMFYEHVIRDHKSASRELKKSAEDDTKVVELNACIKVFDDSVVENLKVLKKYRDDAKDYLDCLYGKNDVKLVLKFIRNGRLAHLVHEFLLIYIGRGIISSYTNLEIVSHTLEAVVGQTIPQSIVEIAFIRLMDTVSRNFPDDDEVGTSVCNFFARSVLDGTISSSYLRTLRTLHAGRIVGYNIIMRTLKWLDVNTNPQTKSKVIKTGTQAHQYARLYNRAKIILAILDFGKNRDSDLFITRIEAIQLDNDDAGFLVKRFIRMGIECGRSDLYWEIVQIFSQLYSRNKIEKNSIGYGLYRVKMVAHTIRKAQRDVDRQIIMLEGLLRKEKLLYPPKVENKPTFPYRGANRPLYSQKFNNLAYSQKAESK